MIRVGRCDDFPGVGAVDGGGAERGQQPGFPVGPVIGQGLAGPFAGDQDPASGVAEVFAAVGFAFAVAGRSPGLAFLGWTP